MSYFPLHVLLLVLGNIVAGNVCEEPWVESGGRCLRAFPSAEPWALSFDDATRACEEMGGELPTLTANEIIAFFETIPASLHDEHFDEYVNLWVNLEDFPPDWIVGGICPTWSIVNRQTHMSWCHWRHGYVCSKSPASLDPTENSPENNPNSSLLPVICSQDWTALGEQYVRLYGCGNHAISNIEAPQLCQQYGARVALINSAEETHIGEKRFWARDTALPEKVGLYHSFNGSMDYDTAPSTRSPVVCELPSRFIGFDRGYLSCNLEQMHDGQCFGFKQEYQQYRLAQWCSFHSSEVADPSREPVRSMVALMGDRDWVQSPYPDCNRFLPAYNGISGTYEFIEYGPKSVVCRNLPQRVIEPIYEKLHSCTLPWIRVNGQCLRLTSKKEYFGNVSKECASYGGSVARLNPSEASAAKQNIGYHIDVFYHRAEETFRESRMHFSSVFQDDTAYALCKLHKQPTTEPTYFRCPNGFSESESKCVAFFTGDEKKSYADAAAQCALHGTLLADPVAFSDLGATEAWDPLFSGCPQDQFCTVRKRDAENNFASVFVPCSEKHEFVCVVSTGNYTFYDPVIRSGPTTCAQGWKSNGNGCFHVFYEGHKRLSRQDAEKRCNLFGGSLANTAESMFFAEAELWGDGVWLQSEESDGDRCRIYDKSRHSWRFWNCKYRRPYVCRIPPMLAGPVCEEGWTRIDDTCFRDFPEPGTTKVKWNSALALCEQNGAELATMNTRERLLFLETYEGYNWLWVNRPGFQPLRHGNKPGAVAYLSTADEGPPGAYRIAICSKPAQ